MIIRTEGMQDVCSKVLSAVDSSELSTITETLELNAYRGILHINVTNREYFAQVKLPVDADVLLHATVNANIFLKLVSQITTDTIELNTSGNSLIVKGNGTYKLPMIFDDEVLLELPEIEINNVTNEFDIDSNILLSILHYNSKELTKGTISKPVQRLYYVDEKGAITFTSGACVNQFNLDKPVRMLLNNRLVKLFKLFKGEVVHFAIGYDNLSDEIIQTKVRFESDSIRITAILSCDDAMLNSVPVAAIRNRATNLYPYSVTLNKEELAQTINRLLLFSDKGTIKLYSTFEFSKDLVKIYDVNKDNSETLYYNNDETSLTDGYTAILDLIDFKTTLESCNEHYVNIHFGDGQAIVLARANILTVIPECKLT